MADAEKEKAEKLAAAKKRVRRFNITLLNLVLTAVTVRTTEGRAAEEGQEGFE